MQPTSLSPLTTEDYKGSFVLSRSPILVMLSETGNIKTRCPQMRIQNLPLTLSNTPLFHVQQTRSVSYSSHPNHFSPKKISQSNAPFANSLSTLHPHTKPSHTPGARKPPTHPSSSLKAANFPFVQTFIQHYPNYAPRTPHLRISGSTQFVSTNKILKRKTLRSA